MKKDKTMHQISEVQEILYRPQSDVIFLTTDTNDKFAFGFLMWLDYGRDTIIEIEFYMSIREWQEWRRWNILEGLLENTIAEINYDEKLNKPESEQVLIELL